jgi:hypothetical protein
MRQALVCLGLGVVASVAAVAGPVSAERPDEVSVCHLDADSGTYKQLSVPQPAAAAHDSHGDARPGDPVPGMAGYTFDESCTVVAPPPDPTRNVVEVLSGPATGSYEASGATFGPAPTEAGVVGPIVLVNDGSASPTQGCGPLIGFPAGAIALVHRGTCPDLDKVLNAQASGAAAVIVMNDVPGAPVMLEGTSDAVNVPAVMVSQSAGATINAGLPAEGVVRADA